MRLTQTLGGSGRRLGGGKLGTNLTPRELAARVRISFTYLCYCLRTFALKAAERRVRDEKACGQGQLAQQEADKAAQHSTERIVIDLTNDGDDSIMPPLERLTPGVVTQKATTTKPSGSTTTTPVIRKAARKPSSPYNQWACPTCTLLNVSSALQCDACLTVRHNDTWACLQCGETGLPNDFWSCRFCGAIKTTS